MRLGRPRQHSGRISEEGEVKSLAAWGIESISLTSQANSGKDIENVRVFGTGTYKLKNGKTGQLNDAGLAYDKGYAPEEEDLVGGAPDIV